MPPITGFFALLYQKRKMLTKGIFRFFMALTTKYLRFSSRFEIKKK